MLGAAWAASVPGDVSADHGDLSIAVEDDAGSRFGSVVLGCCDGPRADAVDLSGDPVEVAFEVSEAFPFLGCLS